MDSIETKEDGHLNLSEIFYLERHLLRNGISWTDAWNACLADLDENYYTTGKFNKTTIYPQNAVITLQSYCKTNDAISTSNLQHASTTE